MLQKNAITEVPPNSPGFYSNVFLVCKASEGWRSVNRLKKFERSHSCTSFSYVHYKLSVSSEYHAKRRLRVQDRPAGCILSCTDSSKQQELIQVCLRKQGLSVSGTCLRSEHSPSDFYLLGAHGNRLPPPSRDFGYSLSGQLARFTIQTVKSRYDIRPAFRDAKPGRFYSKQKEIQAGLGAR